MGIHPEHAHTLDDAGLEWIRSRFSNPKAVAVGEIGLDYYWDEPARDIQKEAFSRQMALAKEIRQAGYHSFRDAAKDTLDMMRERIWKGQSRRHSLFFLCKGDRKTVPGFGIYDWNRRVVTLKMPER